MLGPNAGEENAGNSVSGAQAGAQNAANSVSGVQAEPQNAGNSVSWAHAGVQYAAIVCVWGPSRSAPPRRKMHFPDGKCTSPTDNAPGSVFYAGCVWPLLGRSGWSAWAPRIPWNPQALPWGPQGALKPTWGLELPRIPHGDAALRSPRIDIEKY